MSLGEGPLCAPLRQCDGGQVCTGPSLWGLDSGEARSVLPQVQHLQGQQKTLSARQARRDFPDGPVTETPCSQGRGPRFDL